MRQFYILKNVARADRPIRRRISIHVMFTEDLVLVGFELLVPLCVLGAKHRYSSTTNDLTEVECHFGSSATGRSSSRSSCSS